MKRKGIVLAGGTGSRLYPLTSVLSKHLLPVYDKPMIYYALSVLMLAGIREILVISTRRDLPLFQALLGNGAQWGICIDYAVQEEAAGIAQAFVIAEAFIDNCPSALILGDNIFYGHGLVSLLGNACENVEATVFVHHVEDPTRYGIIERDAQGQVVHIHEKPQILYSQYAVAGLYFYDQHVCKHAKTLRPSARGELEITDLNNLYLKEKKLKIEYMGRGYTWFDVGTCESLLEAQQFISTVEKRQGLKIACLEEIALYSQWIDRAVLQKYARKLSQTQYGQYLLQLLQEPL